MPPKKPDDKQAKASATKQSTAAQNQPSEAARRAQTHTNNAAAPRQAVEPKKTAKPQQAVIPAPASDVFGESKSESKLEKALKLSNDALLAQAIRGLCEKQE